MAAARVGAVVAIILAARRLRHLRALLPIGDLSTCQSKSSAEEGQDFIAGGDGGLARFVDEVHSDDTVRTRYAPREERWDIFVLGAVRKHAPHKTVAERRGVGLRVQGRQPQ
jgi:hypothetical protein